MIDLDAEQADGDGLMPFNLARFSHGPYRLQPMRPQWASGLADELSAMQPWLKLGYSAAVLQRYLAASHHGRQALAVVQTDQAPVACLTLRPDWLRGPMLELLAVLPGCQGEGLGRALIQWLAEETVELGQSSLWTIASGFNHPAREFYRRQGFEEAGILADLISPGEAEILLRLRLGQPPA
jgi:GNAT superfamily N-acetyltransferase